VRDYARERVDRAQVLAQVFRDGEVRCGTQGERMRSSWHRQGRNGTVGNDRNRPTDQKVGGSSPSERAENSQVRAQIGGLASRSPGGCPRKSHRETAQRPNRPNRSNPNGKVNGWKTILNALTIHYGDRINGAY
jgi:hypothetical protein